MPEHESKYAMAVDECWEHLRTQSIGRFATATGGGAPAITPVNYLVHERTVLFRTSPGSKVDETWAHPQAAFEVDGYDGADYWSVVVEGEVELLGLEDPSVSGILESLVSLYPSAKTIAVRLTPQRVSGRRFPRPA